MPGPCGTQARSLRSFRRWTRCEKLDFGAPEHGLRPRGLRFVRAVTCTAARLASGCWPALPSGIGYPQGPDERFPIALPPFPTFPDARTTAFTCRAGCKERGVSKNRNAGPVKCNVMVRPGPAIAVV